MKYIALKNQITRRLVLIASNAALAVGLMVALPQLAQAQSVTPPTVPDNKLQVEAGNEAFLLGHGVGHAVEQPPDLTLVARPIQVGRQGRAQRDRDEERPLHRSHSLGRPRTCTRERSVVSSCG